MFRSMYFNKGEIGIDLSQSCGVSSVTERNAESVAGGRGAFGVGARGQGDGGVGVVVRRGGVRRAGGGAGRRPAAAGAALRAPARRARPARAAARRPRARARRPPQQAAAGTYAS